MKQAREQTGTASRLGWGWISLGLEGWPSGLRGELVAAEIPKIRLALLWNPATVSRLVGRQGLSRPAHPSDVGLEVEVAQSLGPAPPFYFRVRKLQIERFFGSGVSLPPAFWTPRGGFLPRNRPPCFASSPIWR